MPQHWPMRSFLELGALPSAVPCARLHTRQILWEWGLPGLAGSAELLASEMVTNAVQVCRQMRQAAIQLWLLADRTQVLILVGDPSPQAPMPAHPDETSEHGRGLLLVEAISDQWGWYVPVADPGAPAPDHPGKVIWARLTLGTT